MKCHGDFMEMYPSPFFGAQNSSNRARRWPANSRAFCCLRWTSMALLESRAPIVVEGSTWCWTLNSNEKGERSATAANFFKINNMNSNYKITSSTWPFYGFRQWCTFFNCWGCTPKIVLPFSSRIVVSPSWVSGWQWSSPTVPRVRANHSHATRMGKTRKNKHLSEFRIIKRYRNIETDYCETGWYKLTHHFWWIEKWGFSKYSWIHCFRFRSQGISFLFACKARNNYNWS